MEKEMKTESGNVIKTVLYWDDYEAIWEILATLRRIGRVESFRQH